MLGSFYNAFKDNKEHQLPQAVLDIISKDLPKNYGYVYNKQLRRYFAAPLDKDEKQDIKIDFDFEQISEYPDWAKKDPNSMMEYLYRTQKKLKIKKAELKDKDGKLYSMSDLQKDPFSSGEKVIEEYIIPSPFPEGKKVPFQTKSGKTKEIIIRRVPCESRKFIKMSNEDFPALSLTVFIPDVGCNELGKIGVSVTPSKAETVFDAVFSLELLKGYADGTLKINGVCIGKERFSNPSYDNVAIEEKLSLWNGIMCLQEKLGVSFDPRIKLNTNDLRVLDELVEMFVDGKDKKYKAPVEYLAVNKEAIDDPEFKKNAITDNKGLAFSFINGPRKYVLMGAEFDLFTTELMVGFKIDRVELDEDAAKLYIVNAGDDPWILYKRYSLSRVQADIEQKRMQEAYLVSK